MAIDAIFFDIGKVLVDYEYELAGWRLTGGNPEAAAALAEFCEDSEAAWAFNTGRLTPEEYFDVIKEGFGLSVSYDQFKEMYCQIFKENEAGVELFKGLKKKNPIFLISNTNPLHAAYERKAFPFFADVSGEIFSCEVGFAKPDPRIFEAALEKAGVLAGQAVYFDDKGGHVAAAKALGMNAFVFEPNVQKMRGYLTALGVAS